MSFRRLALPFLRVKGGASLLCALFFLLLAVFWPDLGFANPGPIFERFSEADLAPRWLRHLLFQQDLPEFGMQSGPVQHVLRELLRFYSMAMLVFASFLLIYFLFSMWINTGLHGTMLGKRASQTWVPLRVVGAFALMVPLPMTGVYSAMQGGQASIQIIRESLGPLARFVAPILDIADREIQSAQDSTLNDARSGSGLNAAQYIVLSIAEMGSNFASHGWAQFGRAIDLYPASSNENTISASQADNAQNLVRVGACMRAIEVKYLVDKADNVVCPLEPMVSEWAVPFRSGRVERRGESTDSYFSASGFSSVQFAAGKSFQFSGRSPDGCLNNFKECGSIDFPVSSLQNTGDAGNLTSLYGAGGQTRAENLYSAMVRAQVEALKIHGNEFLKYGYGIAEQVLPATALTDAGITSARGSRIGSATQFWNEVRLMDSGVTRNFRASLNSANLASGNLMGTPANPGLERLGWMFAGTMFSSLAREQHIRGTLIDVKPLVGGPKDTDCFRCVGLQNSDLKKLIALAQDRVRLAVQGEPNERGAQYFSQIFANLERPPEYNPFLASRQERDMASEAEAIQIEGLITAAMNRAGIDAGIFPDLNNNGDPDIPAWNAYISRFNPNNAMMSLVQMGVNKLNFGLNLFETAAWLGLSSSALSGAANVLGPAAATLAGMGAAVVGVFITMMTLLGGAGFAAGVLLAFFLPLQIFIRFMFGVMTWLVSVLEAIVAVPLVLLAHLNPEGDGIAPQPVRQAYHYLVQIFLRPILMIFGLAIALLLINSMVGFLNMGFGFAAMHTNPVAFGNGPNLPIPIDGQSDGPIVELIFLLVYAASAYAVVNLLSQVIDILPEQCLSWIGQQGKQYGFNDDSQASQGAIVIGQYAAQKGAQQIVGAGGAFVAVGSGVGGTAFAGSVSAVKMGNDITGLLAKYPGLSAKELAALYLASQPGNLENYINSADFDPDVRDEINELRNIQKTRKRDIMDIEKQIRSEKDPERKRVLEEELKLYKEEFKETEAELQVKLDEQLLKLSESKFMPFMDQSKYQSITVEIEKMANGMARTGMIARSPMAGHAGFYTYSPASGGGGSGRNNMPGNSGA